MRQRGATARRIVPASIVRMPRVSSHQRLFRHVQQRIALYGRDEFARGTSSPVGSFRRSHDAMRRARSRMSLRSIDSRRVGREKEREGEGSEVCVSNHTKRGEIGASGDGKLMGPRGPLPFKGIVFCVRRGAPAPAFHENPQSRPALQWPRGVNPWLSTLRAEIGGRWLVKLIRVKWSLNGTRIDC